MSAGEEENTSDTPPAGEKQKETNGGTLAGAR